MSKKIPGQPKAMTQAELDADAKAAEMELAALQTPEPTPVLETPVVTPAEPTVEPVKTETPAEPPAPAIETPSEIETLKTAIAEKEAKIAELTKRVRDDDGKRGGELTTLRDQVSNLSNQIGEQITEIRELRKKPPQPEVPPEPDELDTQYPEIAAGMDRRTKLAIDAAQRAEELAKKNSEELREIRAKQALREYQGFIDSVKTVVPRWEEYNSDPDFGVWCEGEDPDTGEIRQVTFARCAQQRKSGPAIKLYQKWERSKTNATSVVPPEPSKGPTKPTIAAQVTVPVSAQSTVTTKKQGVDKNRIKFLKDKIERSGKSTIEDRDEYFRLLDEEEREIGTG